MIIIKPIYTINLESGKEDITDNKEYLEQGIVPDAGTVFLN
jgi:hypothetical protein